VEVVVTVAVVVMVVEEGSHPAPYLQNLFVEVWGTEVVVDDRIDAGSRGCPPPMRRGLETVVALVVVAYTLIWSGMGTVGVDRVWEEVFPDRLL
jgi:hypothetical protein